jgi:hypothetical protein
MREESPFPLSPAERLAARSKLLKKFKVINDPFELPQVYAHETWIGPEKPGLLDGFCSGCSSAYRGPTIIGIFVVNAKQHSPFCMYCAPQYPLGLANLRFLAESTELIDAGQIRKAPWELPFDPVIGPLDLKDLHLFKMPYFKKRYQKLEYQLKFNGTQIPDLRGVIAPNALSALHEAIELATLFD